MIRVRSNLALFVIIGVVVLSGLMIIFGIIMQNPDYQDGVITIEEFFQSYFWLIMFFVGLFVGYKIGNGHFSLIGSSIPSLTALRSEDLRSQQKLMELLKSQLQAQVPGTETPIQFLSPSAPPNSMSAPGLDEYAKMVHQAPVRKKA